MEQAIDGATHEAIAKVVERALVLLEVRGAQAITDHHVVAIEDLIHHGGCGVGWVGVIAVGHDVHVGINVFEHGADHVAFALAWFLADDCALGHRDFGGAVGGVVVIYVDIGIRQCCFEIAHHLADGDFLVVTGKKYSDGSVRIIRHDPTISFALAD